MKKRIVILGAGESGTGAALLAKAKGYDVFVSDFSPIKLEYREELELASIPYEEGKHTEALILNADEVVKSPGIPDKAEMAKKIVKKGIPIVSEIEFGFRYAKGKIIAITGSNGKTTTTSLLFHLLKEAGLNVGLGGNIGESFAKKVIDDPYDFWVLELSSFQLDHCFEFSPFISIICNITPDHLDRYEYNFQNYIDSKFRVTQSQTSTDKFIVFTDNEPIISELEKRTILPQMLEISVQNQPKQGAWLNGSELEFNANGIAYSIPVESLSLKGKHNYLNTMAAVLACMELGIEKRNILSGLITFKAVEHRLEEAGIVEGVTFVNDSKATNVDSVFYALDSMETPVVLIMGGVDKGNDYNQIESLVRSKVKALVCMGVDNSKLVGYFYDKLDRIVETNSIQQAVNESFKLAQSGDTVLLSPACASFDLFKNYEDRGKQFKALVQSLMFKVQST
jgi:UDP-N-acetylmuramoylalanine--D-glutamate ligase